MYPGITFRPITEQDLEFLCQLYGTTREAELALVPWNEEQKAMFVRQQFHAQHIFYHDRTRYPNPDFNVILLEDQPIGRIYVHRSPNEIRLMEITIAPDYRNRGIGRALTQDLIDEGHRDGIKVTLHVEDFNPAYRLYLSLGFKPVQTNGIYTLMEYVPT